VSTERSEFYREFSIDLAAAVVHAGSGEASQDKENVFSGTSKNFGRARSTASTPFLGGSSSSSSSSVSQPSQPKLKLDNLLRIFFAEQRREFCCEGCKKAGRTIFPVQPESKQNAGQATVLNGGNGTSSSSSSTTLSSSVSTSNARAVVTNLIRVLPKVLVVHLKRFRYDLDKFTTAVEFPAVLRLPRDLCTQDCRLPDMSAGVDIVGDQFEAIANATLSSSTAQGMTALPGHGGNLLASTAQDASTSTSTSASPLSVSVAAATYELSGVVRHLGRNARSGHYVTDLPDDSYGSGVANLPTSGAGAADSKWRRCDDSTVRQIPLSKVLAEQETAYMLFYSLKGQPTAAVAVAGGADGVSVRLKSD
jgi:hypothetical protein